MKKALKLPQVPLFFFDEVVPTTAVAASVPPIPFVIDRPFFFAIRDNQTETVLFMGVVMDPTM